MGGRHGWRIVAAMALATAALAGCAGGAASGSAGDPAVTPPDPLYRRTFTTPTGREWDFQIGGHVSER